MPPELAHTSLAKFTEPGAVYSGEDVQNLARWKKTLEVMERQLKDSARQQGGLPWGEKVWRPVTMPGKQSANVKALLAEGLERYVKQGETFEQFRWVNR